MTTSVVSGKASPSNRNAGRLAHDAVQPIGADKNTGAQRLTRAASALDRDLDTVVILREADHARAEFDACPFLLRDPRDQAARQPPLLALQRNG